MTILAFTGFRSSGKDTAADYISNTRGYTKDSFANPLKDAAANLFSWPRYLLQGDTPESREWREQIDEWWSNELWNQ